MRMMGTILAVGYHDPIPQLVGFPPGKVRIKMRSGQPARVYVRDTCGIVGYCVEPFGGAWRPAFRIGQTASMEGESAGWMPIETAPKDGGPILCIGSNCNCEAGTITTVEWVDYGKHSYWSLCANGDYAASSDFEPTHWMPMPEPPQ